MKKGPAAFSNAQSIHYSLFVRHSDKTCIEVEFMTYNFEEVSGHYLESSQTYQVSIHKVYIKNHCKATFAERGGGGAVKSISRGDSE